jgi:ABC-2 type transport system ATP-binding protein/lipopolysaccharide transport system ATP-binding protein
MTDPAVSIEDVSKRFRLQKNRPGSLKEKITKRRFEHREEFWALQDINLVIPRGSTYALIGHNGSGKSTLLRLVAGIYRPTTGVVRVDGRISALLELAAGFHPDLTGRENIYLNAAILGLTTAETNRLMGDIIEFSGIAEFIDTPVRHFSSGMYVRLGFSVAVHVNPQILIVDEIIAVGDVEFQRRCYEHLAKLRSAGTTIVMVSHSSAAVELLCDEAAWLDHGHLLATGPASTIAHDYLKQVNQAEKTRLEAELHDEDPDRAAPGVTAEVVDSAGAPLGSITPGDQARLRITASDLAEPVKVALTISDPRGVQLARLVTPGVVSPTTDHPVICSLSTVPLGPGDYRVNVELLDATGTAGLVRFDDATVLRVRAGDRLVEGLVDLRGNWE